MRNLPPEPSPGDKITAELVRELIRCLRERTIIKGQNYSVSSSPNGTLLTIQRPPVHTDKDILPWTFSCSISEGQNGQEEREGGWKNCILQLGYNLFLHSPDIEYITSPDSSADAQISGTDLTADGEYWVCVDVAAKTAEIKKKGSGDTWTFENPNDLANNIVRIYIGTVEDGKQKYGIHHHPVVYIYV